MPRSSPDADATVDAIQALRDNLARRVLARAETRRSLRAPEERLTTAQHLALATLADGPLGTSDLAAGTGVAVSTATRMIQGLVRQGLVEPVEVPGADRRRHHVGLTAEGRRMLRAADQSLRMRIRAVVDEMTPREQVVVVQAVAIMDAALRRVGGADGGAG